MKVFERIFQSLIDIIFDDDLDDDPNDDKQNIMEFQKVPVEIDGELREANIIKTVFIDQREYAIYSVDNGDDTSDIFASEMIQDSEGYDEFKDIEDEGIRENIQTLIDIIFEDDI